MTSGTSHSSAASLSDIDGDFTSASHLQTIQAIVSHVYAIHYVSQVHMCPICHKTHCICDELTPDDPIHIRNVASQIMNNSATTSATMTDSQTSTIGT